MKHLKVKLSKIQNNINHKNYFKNMYVKFALKIGSFLQGNSRL